MSRDAQNNREGREHTVDDIISWAARVVVRRMWAMNNEKGEEIATTKKSETKRNKTNETPMSKGNE